MLAVIASIIFVL